MCGPATAAAPISIGQFGSCRDRMQSRKFRWGAVAPSRSASCAIDSGLPFCVHGSG
jgi:hypothetical protein